MRTIGRRSACLVATLVLVATWPSLADDLKGKFSVAIQSSYYSISDEIRSNADNLAVVKLPGGLIDVVSDPRADVAATRSASIRDGIAWGINAKYGVAKWKWGQLLIDANYNYFDSSIDNLEVSAKFRIYDTDPNSTTFGMQALPCNGCKRQITGIQRYTVFPTQVGKITWHNPQIGALVRFRQGDKREFPYVGLGFGRYIVSNTRSGQLNSFSDNLASSTGSYDRSPYSAVPPPTPVPKKLGPITVTAPDATEYHVNGGVDFPLKNKWKHWTVYLDGRWAMTNGKVTIKTDGTENFGQPIPDGRFDKLATGLAGVQIGNGGGGLTDFGSAIPDFDHPGRFKFRGKDGILDPGNVFVQGGSINYGGYLLSVGMRYVF